jgi:hypothetical protein
VEGDHQGDEHDDQGLGCQQEVTIMARSPINKGWMLEALSDREWHPLYELVNRASRYIVPEQVSRKAYEERKRRKKPTLGLEKTIRYGVKEMVRKVLSNLRVLGLIEARNGVDSDEYEVRYIAWYCWVCGRMLATPKTLNGQCGKCAVHCWNCGGLIEEPRLVDDELCSKCQKIYDALHIHHEILNSLDIEQQEQEPQQETQSEAAAIAAAIRLKPVQLRFQPINDDIDDEKPEPPIVQSDGGELEETGVYRLPTELKKRRKKPRKPKAPKL